jgi:AcrR family transcriptional regulator
MENDTKNRIFREAMLLLSEGKKKKLTVSDICERCGITRQTFYHYFQDVPEVFVSFAREGESHFDEIQKEEDWEKVCKAFLLIGIHVRNGARKGMLSAYGPEIGPAIHESVRKLVDRYLSFHHLLEDMNPEKKEFIISYHGIALTGIAASWDPANDYRIDQAVKVILALMRSSAYTETSESDI